jgi:hypothetical protein
VQRVSDGAELETDVLLGASLAAAGIELDEPPAIDTDVVAIRIARLTSDDVVQLRLPRACVEGPPLLLSRSPWDTPRRLANTVLLPHRWYLLEASLPTVVSRADNGCTRIEFDAPADDASDVLLTLARHSLATAV